MNRPALDSPNLGQVPAHALARDSIVPPSTIPLRDLPAGAWFAALADHLPNPYVHAYASELARLRADGCTPSEAAVYCRAYLFAPRIYDERRDGPNGLPPMAPVASATLTIPRSLADDLELPD